MNPPVKQYGFVLILNGGHKEATLELLARKLYNNLRDKNNIIFFENLKLLKIA